MLHLLGLCSTSDAAIEVAERFDGRSWIAHQGEKPTAPYRGMVEVATDDIESVTSAADVGLYVSFTRTIKQPTGERSPERVIASFAMVGHPDLTHRQADDHWRDTHGPVALRSHLAMCDYQQLSIVATLAGPELDGMAMCAFDTRKDLSERFFNDDAAKADVIADVAKFAHPRASMARVVLEQVR